MAINKILIVDDDFTTSIILEKFLIKSGFSVTKADSAIKGSEIIKNEQFPIVITDINMPEISGLDFLLWIKENYPDTYVIVITGYGTDEIKDFVTKKGALNYFVKPVNLKKLLELIRFSTNKAFSGNISDVNLFDFINIMSLSGKQKSISITDQETKKKGLIFLKGKRVIHAEFDDSQGKEAFLKIMRIKKGAFSEVEWVEPVEASVNMQSATLLIETFQIIENEASSQSKKRILIVDDDPITPLIIEKYLSMQGFEVITAQSAKEGANILKSHFIDLVITDLVMPEVNGLEFMLWIKEHSPRSSVIIITAYGSHAIKKFANQRGALNYFEKPVNLKELNTFIKDSFIDKGFSGGILEITLMDFIQIIVLSKSKKLISVVDPVENSEGKIYINNGNIIHAESKNLSGKEAFFSIFEMKSGIFFDLPWVEPIESTIKTDFFQLVLEKAIVTDEENLKHNKTPNKKENSIVRARPKFLEKIIEKNEAIAILNKETNPIRRLCIYESGVALGIVLGKTGKDEVIMEMVKYSNVSASLQRENQIFIFDDISVMIIFNEDGIADEINFGRFYKGKTSLGIGIGDTIISAIKIYGKPKICTIKGAVWENIAFFSQNGSVISSIRLRSSGFFELSKTLPSISPLKLLDKPAEPELTPDKELLETDKIKGKRRLRKKEKLFSSGEEEFIKKSERKKIHEKHLNEPKEKMSEIFKTDYKAGNIQETEIIPDERFSIYETGSAMNITIGKTRKQEVLDIAGQYSREGLSQLTDKFIHFEDIGFSALFDEKGVVIEMKFEYPYNGVTTKGLKIGDELTKAYKIYGKPDYKSKISSIWKKFAVFCDEDNDIISCIRLKK